MDALVFHPKREEAIRPVCIETGDQLIKRFCLNKGIFRRGIGTRPDTQTGNCVILAGKKMFVQNL